MKAKSIASPARIAGIVLLGTVLLGTVLAGCKTGSGGDSEEESSRRSQATPTVALEHLSYSEGSRGPNSISIPLSLSNTSEKEVRISYEIVDGEATSEDYEGESGDLIFPKGSRRQNIEFTLIGDTQHEPDETFEIHLTRAVNAEIDRDGQDAVITINDDDQSPVVRFVTERQTVAETVGETTVHVSLSEPSGFPIELPMRIEGTAKEDDDYALPDGASISMTPGQVDSQITVSINRDNIQEGGETIRLAFGSPTGATISAEPGESEHVIVVSGEAALNDTGVVSFATETEQGLWVEPSSHPRQDGSTGRDSNPNRNHDLDGTAGFSFTKLDGHGNPLAPQSTTWACVRDNVTGLVWENKSATGWRSGNHVYAWHSEDSQLNGGNPGAMLDTWDPTANPQPYCSYIPSEGADRRPYKLFCSTDTYVKDMNHYGVCGFDDWRLPEVQELRSIAAYMSDQELALPVPEFFSNTSSKNYFSSTPSADNEASAWCLSASGDVELCNKGSYMSIRAVRNGE